MEHQIDYKQKYKVLKKKLKFLVYEQECFLEELRKAQRRLLKVSRDRSFLLDRLLHYEKLDDSFGKVLNFLLDRLLQYEKLDDSSGDSDMTASSDSETESQKQDGASGKRKRGNVTVGFDPSAVLGGMGFTSMSQGPSKKKGKTTTKKKASKKSAPPTNPMSRAELERHLESKQEMFGIEKAPALLPMEIFSNDNSNLDSDAMLDIKNEDDDDLVVTPHNDLHTMAWCDAMLDIKDEEDDDLVIDAPQ